MTNRKKLFQSAYINFSESTGEFEKKFLNCLRQRKIDVDFTFWGRNATRAWINILETPAYIINNSENQLLNQNLDKLVKSIKLDDDSINIISLCCGVLDREKTLIKGLAAKKEVTYVPIDSSIDIINASLKSVSNIENTEILPFISSLNYLKQISYAVRQNHHKASLFTLFCNILGNHPQVPLLSNIHNSMLEDDYLLLGVQLLSSNFSDKDLKIQNEEIKNILRSYNNETYLDFLYQFIYRAGFEKADGFFEIEFTRDKLYPSLSSIEIYFCLKQDKKIQYLGENIIYRKGERIQIRFSYIYSSEVISSILTENGFKIENKLISDKKDFSLILCKKV